MQIVMAVSADGFVNRGPDDKMDWLGATDKAIFRLLTVGKVLGCGPRTFELMPKLPGRTVKVIRRNGYCLADFATQHPHDGVIIGGQVLAVNAMLETWSGVSHMHVCHSDRRCFVGERSVLDDCLERPRWKRILKTTINDVQVHTWERNTLAMEAGHVGQHSYVPSATHMGDCAICGHIQEDPIHGS